jgi:DNA-binding NarL/FixJ family response regulator
MNAALSDSPDCAPTLKNRRARSVVFVEDQADIRESWAQLIGSFPDFSCIGAFASGEEALKKIPTLRPDIVLMDIFLPRISGIECTARLKAVLPDIQIVMLTAVAYDELVFLALEAGADGYLLKRTKPEDLRSALLDVLNGGAPMTSQIARRVVRYFRQKSKLVDAGVRLSMREEELLSFLSKGFSNKEIADKLGLSVDTISTYLKNIYKKMHVHSRAEAVARYLTSKPG